MTKAWFQDGKLVVQETQDVAPIIEANKALQGERQTGDFRRVASIPNVIIDQWAREGLHLSDKNAWPEIKRRLNSSDWRFLRTDSSRI
jgi:hypothetical protein